MGKGWQMSGYAVRPGVVLLVAGAFLLLVILHIWLGDDRPAELVESGPQLSRLEVAERGEQIELGYGMTAAELEELMVSRLHLLESGEVTERRAVAIQVALEVGDPLEADRYLRMPAELKARLREALLRRLNDEDVVVSVKSREALLGIWRTSESVAATEGFHEGLAAWNAGRLDEALEIFRSVERLPGSAPPDLYRMKAEVHLAQDRPQDALEACRRALEAEPRNFEALLVVARAYLRRGERERAMTALETALQIYHRFPAAEQLRRQLIDESQED